MVPQFFEWLELYTNYSSKKFRETKNVLISEEVEFSTKGASTNSDRIPEAKTLRRIDSIDNKSL